MQIAALVPFVELVLAWVAADVASSFAVGPEWAVAVVASSFVVVLVRPFGLASAAVASAFAGAAAVGPVAAVETSAGFLPAAEGPPAGTLLAAA